MRRAPGLDPATLIAAFAAQHGAVTGWLDDLPADLRQRLPLVAPPAGGADLDALIGLLDRTRDLHDTVPEQPPPYVAAALAAVSRGLAGRLAAAVPGRSVEVRIPPYAAVQCVAGPRHARGTPGGVVETDPMTWLDLATGRLTWAAALATGRLTASGERTDLTGYLPLLRSGNAKPSTSMPNSPPAS